MELIFFNRQSFNIIDNGYVNDEFQIIIDSVVPQKSSFSVNKTNINANVGDLVAVKSNVINYIGIICSLEEDKEKGITKLQTNDFISILNIKVLLVSFSGNLSLYLYNLLFNTFISNSDIYQRFSYLTIARDYNAINGSLTFENDTIDTISSLLNTLSKAYSIGLTYELRIENGKIEGITLHITNVKRGLIVRSDLAEIQNLAISSSDEQTINKIKFIPSSENNSYTSTICYYLLNDGSITTYANAPTRIKNVSQLTKIYKDEDYQSLSTTAQKEMLVSSLEHSIEFSLRMNNKVLVPFIDFKVGDFVEFRAKNKTYNTLVSKFTFKNNLYQVFVTLGEYRISLTDKIKLLNKK